eukprot:5392897-Amphidinium_carterae.1
MWHVATCRARASVPPCPTVRGSDQKGVVQAKRALQALDTVGRPHAHRTSKSLRSAMMFAERCLATVCRPSTNSDHVWTSNTPSMKATCESTESIVFSGGVLLSGRSTPIKGDRQYHKHRMSRQQTSFARESGHKLFLQAFRFTCHRLQVNPSVPSSEDLDYTYALYTMHLLSIISPQELYIIGSQ